MSTKPSLISKKARDNLKKYFKGINKLKFLVLLILFIPQHILAGELSDLFRELDNGSANIREQSRSHKEVRSDAHGITEIGLERTSCLGKCPAYTVIFRSDGTFEYFGELLVDRIGKHSGTVSKWHIRSLFQFISDSSYFAFQNSYYRAVTDNSTVYTLVKMKGKVKIVKNYANSGPIRLWAMEELIDKLLLEANWD